MVVEGETQAPVLAKSGVRYWFAPPAVGALLGIVFLGRHYLAGYLGWGTVGIAISATAVAIAALILGLPAGVYAVAAVLLVVLAELLRASVHVTERAELIRQARRLAGPRRWRVGEELLARSRWPSHPGSMAAAGSAVPAAIAVALAARSAFNVAAILIGWGCILSMAAIRAGRPEQQQRLLFYTAAGSALISVWLLRFNPDMAQGLLPEGLTLPFAILAFVVGLHQLQQRPELGSWAAYGPALIAAFAPTIAVIIVPEPDPVRIVALLAGGIGVLVWGSVKQQRAPLAIGAAVTTIVAFDALITAGQIWLAIGIAGIVVLAIGATEEGRRRSMGRYKSR